MWLTDRIIIINEQLHVRIAKFVDFSLSLSNSARIVFTTYSNYLHEFFRVVEIVDFLDCLAVDILFILGRQKNCKGKTWVEKNRRSVVKPCMFRFLPDKQT